MEYSKEQIDELRGLGTELKIFELEKITYFLISNLPLPDGCSPSRSDVLLRPSDRKDGYPSRLFFPQKVVSRLIRNWNPPDGALIGDRVWFAVSWKIEVPGLRLVQLVGAHLEAMR